MDIKIGKITYGPDATEAKIAKESKSYSGTKLPFGFSVLGIISHSDNGFKRFTKGSRHTKKVPNFREFSLKGGGVKRRSFSRLFQNIS